eukprot:gene2216-2926_t
MEYVLGGRQLVEARPPPDLPAGEGACSGGSNDVLAAMASAGQQGRAVVEQIAWVYLQVTKGYSQVVTVYSQ